MLILCLLCITFLSLTSAQPPGSTVIVQDRGVDVVHPETILIQDNEDLEINFWTYNSTNGKTLTNSSLNCTVYIINNSGVNFFRFSNQPDASGLITYGKGAPLCVNCWTMILPAENNKLGDYSYQIKCQGNGVGGYSTGQYKVTYTGTEVTVQESILYFAFIFLLLTLIMSATFGIFYFNDTRGRLALYWTIHLLTIALTFMLWNMGYNILEYNTFIPEFFRILFFLSIITFLPMFFLSIVYIIKQHFINKNVMDLINSGYDQNDAERIAMRAAKNE
jgi:hypothetical protein